MEIEAIEKELKSILKPERFRHTIGVMDTAVLLAAKYSAPTYKARLAGLLHDCAKELAGALDHAPKGAELASRLYGISDKEVLMAISSHTTGRADMGMLEKIIFVADYIEPNRDFKLRTPRLDWMRRKAFEDIDAVIAPILEDTFEYLKENGRAIDAASVDTYNFYKAYSDRTGLFI